MVMFVFIMKMGAVGLLWLFINSINVYYLGATIVFLTYTVDACFNAFKGLTQPIR